MFRKALIAATVALGILLLGSVAYAAVTQVTVPLTVTISQMRGT